MLYDMMLEAGNWDEKYIWCKMMWEDTNYKLSDGSHTNNGSNVWKNNFT